MNPGWQEKKGRGTMMMMMMSNHPKKESGKQITELENHVKNMKIIATTSMGMEPLMI